MENENKCKVIKFNVIIKSGNDTNDDFLSFFLQAKYKKRKTLSIYSMTCIVIYHHLYHHHHSIKYQQNTQKFISFTCLFDQKKNQVYRYVAHIYNTHTTLKFILLRWHNNRVRIRTHITLTLCISYRISIKFQKKNHTFLHR